MGADPEDATVVDDDDLIRPRNRRNALGNNHDRGIRRLLPKRGAHPCIGSHVERGEGIVEEVDGGPADDRTRDGQPLPLSTREIDAALRDAHGQSVGVVAHEAIGGRHPHRVPHLVLGRVSFAVAQIVGDGAGEQISTLWYHADRRPQLLGIEVAHVDSVHAH